MSSIESSSATLRDLARSEQTADTASKHDAARFDRQLSATASTAIRNTSPANASSDQMLHPVIDQSTRMPRPQAPERLPEPPGLQPERVNQPVNSARGDLLTGGAGADRLHIEESDQSSIGKSKPHDSATDQPSRGNPRRGLTEGDYARIAEAMGVEIAALQAVAIVQSLGPAFLPSGKPRIRFDVQLFGELTRNAYAHRLANTTALVWNRTASNPDEHEHERLDQAAALNRRAAFKATGWGRFELFGAVYRRTGYHSLRRFVEAMSSSEVRQLEAFATLIESHHELHSALKNKDWRGFARIYNAQTGRQSHYEQRMRAEYEQLKSYGM